MLLGAAGAALGAAPDSLPVGLLRLCLVAVMAVTAGYAVRHAIPGLSPGAEGAVASIVAAWVAVYSCFVLPALFGLAHPPILLSLAGVMTALLARRPKAGALVVVDTVGSPALCAGLAIVLLAFVQRARYVDIDADSLWYHLPMVATWYKSGSIGIPESVPVMARAYPGFREVIQAMLSVPFHNENLSALLGATELVLVMAAVVGLARVCGVLAPLALGMGAYVVAMPQTVLAPNGNDAMLAGGAIGAVLLVRRGALLTATHGARMAQLLAGAALGMLASLKYSGLGYAVLSLVVGTALAGAEDNRPPLRHGLYALLVATAGAVCIAAPWYVRNAMVFGNPLYPAPVGLGPFHLRGALPPNFLSSNTLGWQVWPLIERADFFLDAFGALAPLLLLSPLWLATRVKGRSWSVAPIIALAVGACVLFLHNPFNTVGRDFNYNLRFALPWLLASSVGLSIAVAYSGSRWPQALSLGLAALACLTTSAWTRYWAFPCAVLALGWLATTRTRPLPFLEHALQSGKAVVLVSLAGAIVFLGAFAEISRGRAQLSVDYGYRDLPSTRGWGQVVRYAHLRLRGERILVFGDNRTFPLYGDRFENHVFLHGTDAFIIKPPVPNAKQVISAVQATDVTYAAIFPASSPDESGFGFSGSACQDVARTCASGFSVVVADGPACLLKVQPGVRSCSNAGSSR